MLKAIKIRLYPNKEQTIQFNQLLGCYRFVYNNCLNRKIESYKKDKTSENLTSLGKYFHNDLNKNLDYYWINDQPTKVLKQAIIDMLSGYKRFFTVKGTGFPKFKSKHDNNASCRFPLEAISKRNDYSTKRLSLANIKHIKFKCSKRYVNDLVRDKQGIRSATLSKTPTGKYFLSILVDSSEYLIKEPLDTTVGVDLGIKDFAVTSDGQVFENLRFKKKQGKKLKRSQRQLSKKVKGSKNRDKARIRVAMCHEKIKNQTNNYLHEVSSKLINENQVISIEDLNVSGMMKNHKLAENIQSLSLSKFRTMLEYKALFYGRNVVVISRWFPSTKLCSCCTHKNNNLTLKDRHWTCPECGEYHNRDLNAAINIDKEGLRLLSLQYHDDST